MARRNVIDIEIVKHEKTVKDPTTEESIKRTRRLIQLREQQEVQLGRLKDKEENFRKRVESQYKLEVNKEMARRMATDTRIRKAPTTTNIVSAKYDTLAMETRRRENEALAREVKNQNEYIYDATKRFDIRKRRADLLQKNLERINRDEREIRKKIKDTRDSIRDEREESVKDHAELMDTWNKTGIQKIPRATRKQLDEEQMAKVISVRAKEQEEADAMLDAWVSRWNNLQLKRPMSLHRMIGGRRKSIIDQLEPILRTGRGSAVTGTWTLGRGKDARTITRIPGMANINETFRRMIRTGEVADEAVLRLISAQHAPMPSGIIPDKLLAMVNRNVKAVRTGFGAEADALANKGTAFQTKAVIPPGYENANYMYKMNRWLNQFGKPSYRQKRMLTKGVETQINNYRGDYYRNLDYAMDELRPLFGDQFVGLVKELASFKTIEPLVRHTVDQFLGTKTTLPEELAEAVKFFGEDAKDALGQLKYVYQQDLGTKAHPEHAVWNFRRIIEKIRGKQEAERTMSLAFMKSLGQFEGKGLHEELTRSAKPPDISAYEAYDKVADANLRWAQQNDVWRNQIVANLNASNLYDETLISTLSGYKFPEVPEFKPTIDPLHLVNAPLETQPWYAEIKGREKIEREIDARNLARKTRGRFKKGWSAETRAKIPAEKQPLYDKAFEYPDVRMESKAKTLAVSDFYGRDIGKPKEDVYNALYNKYLGGGLTKGLANLTGTIDDIGIRFVKLIVDPLRLLIGGAKLTLGQGMTHEGIAERGTERLRERLKAEPREANILEGTPPKPVRRKRTREGPAGVLLPEQSEIDQAGERVYDEMQTALQIILGKAQQMEAANVEARSKARHTAELRSEREIENLIDKTLGSLIGQEIKFREAYSELSERVRIASIEDPIMGKRLYKRLAELNDKNKDALKELGLGKYGDVITRKRAGARQVAVPPLDLEEAKPLPEFGKEVPPEKRLPDRNDPAYKKKVADQLNAKLKEKAGKPVLKQAELFKLSSLNYIEGLEYAATLVNDRFLSVAEGGVGEIDENTIDRLIGSTFKQLNKYLGDAANKRVELRHTHPKESFSVLSPADVNSVELISNKFKQFGMIMDKFGVEAELGGILRTTPNIGTAPQLSEAIEDLDKYIQSFLSNYPVKRPIDLNFVMGAYDKILEKHGWKPEREPGVAEHMREMFDTLGEEAEDNNNFYKNIRWFTNLRVGEPVQEIPPFKQIKPKYEQMFDPILKAINKPKTGAKTAYAFDWDETVRNFNNALAIKPFANLTNYFTNIPDYSMYEDYFMWSNRLGAYYEDITKFIRTDKLAKVFSNRGIMHATPELPHGKFRESLYKETDLAGISREKINITNTTAEKAEELYKYFDQLLEQDSEITLKVVDSVTRNQQSLQVALDKYQAEHGKTKRIEVIGPEQWAEEMGINQMRRFSELPPRNPYFTGENKWAGPGFPLIPQPVRTGPPKLFESFGTKLIREIKQIFSPIGLSAAAGGLTGATFLPMLTGLGPAEAGVIGGTFTSYAASKIIPIVQTYLAQFEKGNNRILLKANEGLDNILKAGVADSKYKKVEAELIEWGKDAAEFFRQEEEIIQQVSHAAAEAIQKATGMPTQTAAERATEYYGHERYEFAKVKKGERESPLGMPIGPEPIKEILQVGEPVPGAAYTPYVAKEYIRRKEPLPVGASVEAMAEMSRRQQEEAWQTAYPEYYDKLEAVRARGKSKIPGGMDALIEKIQEFVIDATTGKPIEGFEKAMEFARNMTKRLPMQRTVWETVKRGTGGFVAPRTEEEFYREADVEKAAREAYEKRIMPQPPEPPVETGPETPGRWARMFGEEYKIKLSFRNYDEFKSAMKDVEQLPGWLRTSTREFERWGELGTDVLHTMEVRGHIPGGKDLAANMETVRKTSLALAKGPSAVTERSQLELGGRRLTLAEKLKEAAKWLDRMNWKLVRGQMALLGIAFSMQGAIRLIQRAWSVVGSSLSDLGRIFQNFGYTLAFGPQAAKDYIRDIMKSSPQIVDSWKKFTGYTATLNSLLAIFAFRLLQDTRVIFAINNLVEKIIKLLSDQVFMDRLFGLIAKIIDALPGAVDWIVKIADLLMTIAGLPGVRSLLGPMVAFALAAQFLMPILAAVGGAVQFLGWAIGGLAWALGVDLGAAWAKITALFTKGWLVEALKGAFLGASAYLETLWVSLGLAWVDGITGTIVMTTAGTIAAVGVGIAAGFAGVWILMKLGLMDWLADISVWFDEHANFLWGPLKTLLWPLAMIGTIVMDLLSGQADKIGIDVQIVFLKAAKAAAQGLRWLSSVIPGASEFFEGAISNIDAKVAELMAERGGGGWVGYATGGSVQAGQPIVVGEKGPEVFVPSGAGTIVPNHMVGYATGTNTFGSFGLNGQTLSVNNLTATVSSGSVDVDNGTIQTQANVSPFGDDPFALITARAAETTVTVVDAIDKVSTPAKTIADIMPRAYNQWQQLHYLRDIAYIAAASQSIRNPTIGVSGGSGAGSSTPNTTTGPDETPAVTGTPHLVYRSIFGIMQRIWQNTIQGSEWFKVVVDSAGQVANLGRKWTDQDFMQWMPESALPAAATGGYVARTGAAVIHKGETITPADEVEPQNVTITNYVTATVNNKTDEKYLLELLGRKYYSGAY